MKPDPLAAFAALLSFAWSLDPEEPGKWLGIVTFNGFPHYEPAAVVISATRDPIWEKRIAWDVAADLRREEGTQIPFRCGSAFVPVVCAACRVTCQRP